VTPPTTIVRFYIIILLIFSSRVSASPSSPSSPSGTTGFGNGTRIGVGTASKSGMSIRGDTSNGYAGTLIGVSI